MLKHLKVLIIDDDQDDVRLVSDFLKEARRTTFIVDSVESGEEAHQKLEEAYDVILMDYKLPDMTGLDLISWMKANLNRCPVILITSHGDKRLQLEALEAGCAEYLEKGTFDSILLERTILYAIKLNQFKYGEIEHSEPFKALTEQVLCVKNLVEDLKKDQEELKKVQEETKWDRFKEFLNWVTLHPMIALVGFILLMTLIILLVLLLQVLDVDKVKALNGMNSGLTTYYITT